MDNNNNNMFYLIIRLIQNKITIKIRYYFIYS